MTPAAPSRVLALGAALVLLTGVLIAITRGSSCPAFAMTVGGRGFDPGAGEGGVRINVVVTDGHLRSTHAVTHDNESLGPAISPDGRQIAYESADGLGVDPETGPNGSRLHVMNLDGSHDHVVSDGYDIDPAWSPDGSALLFNRRSGSAGLWMVDLSSGRQTQIREASGLNTNVRPQWLSNGRILFATFSEVESILPSGGSSVSLAHLAGYRSPLFSPDGSRYAISGPQHGDPIEVVDVRSGRATDVPGSATQLAEPLIWTYQGRLVFTQNVRGAGINIVSWREGDDRPSLISRVTGIPLDLADNPACAP